MRMRVGATVGILALVAVMAAGCGAADVPGPSRSSQAPTSLTIKGDGHEVNLYRMATDGEALYLTDELVPVLYRLDLETGSVTETRLNELGAWTPTGEPSDIGVAVGGGAVWVSDPCKGCPAGDIYRIERGKVLRWASLPEPFWMTWSQGRLWVSSFARDEVVALDPETGKVAHRVAVSGPSGIVEGFERVWMVGSHGNNVVVEDPGAGTQRSLSLGEPMAKNPEHVVVAAGSIWVNNPAGSLFRIDPSTLDSTVYAVPEPFEIEGADDAVWIGSGQGLYRLDADGTKQHWALPEISGLAVTEDAVYAAEVGGHTVHRVGR